MQDVAARLAAMPERPPHVVAMPDFFLDHFVPMPPFPSAVEAMTAIHARGGGNLHGGGQSIQAGGNAANTAHALARLGVRVHLVARTSPFGLAYLRETLGRAGVDLQQIRSDGRLASTVALEFQPGPRNVMLSDAGSVAEYGPADLDDNVRTLIEGADAVLLANWSQTHRFGTELAEAVLKEARRGRALTYVDTGDPASRRADIPDFLSRIASSPSLDVFAMNESELRIFGDGDVAGEEAILATGARLAKRMSATLDVHTAEFAATWGPRGDARVATRRIRPLRATGAGDAWNAGNLLGYALGLTPGERLDVANAVAGLYLAAAHGLPPTLSEVVRALR